jgi:formylglycine-generating enzyme required for sulfatase activity
LRVKLPAGDYFVVAVGQESGRFHEVFRRVPRSDQIGTLKYRQERWDPAPGNAVKLADISLPLPSVGDGMVLLPGGEDFTMGDNASTELPLHHRRLPPFLLDQHEVTIAEFTQSGIYKLRQDLLEAPEDNAMALVMYDEAASWAEHAGKILPTETMYEFAATGGGARRYPWGDDAPRSTDWPMGNSSVAPHDRTPTDPPVLGLYSNVAEWTSTWMQFYPRIARQNMEYPSEPREYRVVRGAPGFVIEGAGLTEDAQLGPRNRNIEPWRVAKPTIGFRCARSVRPHLTAADFERVLRDGP